MWTVCYFLCILAFKNINKEKTTLCWYFSVQYFLIDFLNFIIFSSISIDLNQVERLGRSNKLIEFVHCFHFKVFHFCLFPVLLIVKTIKFFSLGCVTVFHHLFAYPLFEISRNVTSLFRVRSSSIINLHAVGLFSILFCFQVFVYEVKINTDSIRWSWLKIFLRQFKFCKSLDLSSTEKKILVKACDSR